MQSALSSQIWVLSCHDVCQPNLTLVLCLCIVFLSTFVVLMASMSVYLHIASSLYPTYVGSSCYRKIFVHSNTLPLELESKYLYSPVASTVVIFDVHVWSCYRLLQVMRSATEEGIVDAALESPDAQVPHTFEEKDEGKACEEPGTLFGTCSRVCLKKTQHLTSFTGLSVLLHYASLFL